MAIQSLLLRNDGDNWGDFRSVYGHGGEERSAAQLVHRYGHHGRRKLGIINNRNISLYFLSHITDIHDEFSRPKIDKFQTRNQILVIRGSCRILRGFCTANGSASRIDVHRTESRKYIR